ncbi:MAG: hypothetical protein BMS9Abin26_0580 [Gammaproteobacteria bacterium]|nr:MAG: hypothetical protein BMS9Abin26_0580 [Gammaproteobacteria bacterium]
MLILEKNGARHEWRLVKTYNAVNAVIPAKAGIQKAHDVNTLDSGSPLHCARNDSFLLN